MKSLLVILGLVTIFNQVAEAGFYPEHSCKGDNGEELVVEHFTTRSLYVHVSADFKKDNVTHKLSGSTNLKNPSYVMDNINGKKVFLTVTEVSSYGGNCGRCSPVKETETNAKLIIGDEEYDFSCE